MGFTPQDMDRMSLWQMSAVINGYAAAHSGKGGGLSEAEKDSLFDWVDAMPAGRRTLRTERWAWDDAGPVRRGIVEYEVT